MRQAHGLVNAAWEIYHLVFLLRLFCLKMLVHMERLGHGRCPQRDVEQRVHAAR